MPMDDDDVTPAAVRAPYGAYADAFLDGYTECALWSSHVYPDLTDEPIPADECGARLSGHALDVFAADCADFRDSNAEVLAASGLSAAQAGHDFWLTRNHHGAGYWDRGLPADVSDALTGAADAWGTQDLYLTTGPTGRGPVLEVG